MYTRCLICGASFPEGRVLKHLPHGDRVAYDLQRGRLWLVCRSCRRWSLVPLEARWEVLEELERLLSEGRWGPEKVVPGSKTGSIALFSVGSLEIIRVLEADLAEEAGWRYGPHFPWASSVSAKLPRPSPWLKASGVVWKGRRVCPGCGHGFTEIPFADRNILIVRPPSGQSGTTRAGPSESLPVLTRRCPRCKDAIHGGLHLRGMEGELTLFRLLAFEHHTGAPMDRIQAAARLVQDPDGPATLVRILTEHGRPLGDLPPVGILALEMVVSQARELSLLKLELGELDFRLRQEEELAGLMDGELTPVPLWARMVRRVRGEG